MVEHIFIHRNNLEVFQMFSLKSMLSSLPAIGNRLGKFPSSIIKLGECKTFPTATSEAGLHTSPVTETSAAGSIWRLPRYDGKAGAVWPNHVPHYTHRK